TRRAMKHLAQWLDHHFFLTDQLIHHKTDTTGTDTDDNNVSFVLQTFALCAFDEPLFQMEQRYGLITDGDAFLTVHHVALAQIHMENFVHVGQRQSECLLAEHDHQGRHDCESQWHFDNQASALANGRLDFNTAVELGNLGLYHIHADTTAGHIGNFFLGREAGRKDQVERFGVRQAICSIFVKHASLDCDATQFHGVHTGTIVGDGQENMIALLLGGQYDLPYPRFAIGFAHIRQFNTVIDRVTHQVHQRIGQRFYQVFIQIRVFTDQIQIDFFFQVARQIAHHTRKTTKHFFDRLHAGFHYRHLQIGSDYIEVGHSFCEGFILRACTETHQTVTYQHQLPHHVHDVIQTLGVHAYSGFHSRRSVAGFFFSRCYRLEHFGRFTFLRSRG